MSQRDSTTNVTAQRHHTLHDYQHSHITTPEAIALSRLASECARRYEGVRMRDKEHIPLYRRYRMPNGCAVSLNFSPAQLHGMSCVDAAIFLPSGEFLQLDQNNKANYIDQTEIEAFFQQAVECIRPANH